MIILDEESLRGAPGALRANSYNRAYENAEGRTDIRTK